jgi:sugar phosphate permease
MLEAQGGSFVNDASLASRALSTPARAHVSARWAVSAMLLLAVTTAFFDRINVAVLFGNKDFQADIGVSDPALMGLLMTAFVFPYGASMMLFSISGDLFGPRRTLSAVAAILAGIMAFMAAVSSYAFMLAGRVVIGVTEGPQFGAATATVKRWFAPREQSLGNAFWTIGSPLGSAIGFPLVFFLVAQYGWRASFYVLAALNAFIVLPVIWFFLRDSPEDAAIETREEKISFAEGFAMFARDPKFWLVLFYDCGVLIYLWGLNAWLPTYLQEARHFNLASTSFFSSLPYVLMLVGQILLAWLADTTGRRAAVCGGALVMTGVFIGLAAIVPDGITAAWCIAISAGFWGGTTPTLFALGCQIIPANVTAAGFGVYAGFANAVGSMAPLIIGILVGRTGEFTAGLMFLVACCFISSLAMIPLMRKY